MLFWIENLSIFSVLFYKKDGLYDLSGHDKTTNRYMPGFLSFIPDIGYFTYILTFTTNFFIFYCFNKNFKETVVFF
jgi:hypothetical protein